MVEYHPISARDFSRIHHFSKKVLLGIFLGYELSAGEIWKADLEDLEKLDASEIDPRERSIVNTKRRWIHVPQNCQGETTNSEYPLYGRNNL